MSEDLFNGQWRIDLESGECMLWDEAKGGFVPDEVGDERITISVEDGVQDYEVLLGDRPVITMGYASRYNDMTWVPYVVRAIGGVPEAEVEDAVAGLRERIRTSPRTPPMKVGQALSELITIKVDERTHYRITRTLNHHGQYTMLRRMAEDGESYKATVLDKDGIVRIIRKFRRVT